MFCGGCEVTVPAAVFRASEERLWMCSARESMACAKEKCGGSVENAGRMRPCARTSDLGRGKRTDGGKDADEARDWKSCDVHSTHSDGNCVGVVWGSALVVSECPGCKRPHRLGKCASQQDSRMSLMVWYRTTCLVSNV